VLFKPACCPNERLQVRATTAPTEQLSIQSGYAAPHKHTLGLREHLRSAFGADVALALTKQHLIFVLGVLLNKKRRPDSTDERDTANAAMNHFANALTGLCRVPNTHHCAPILFGYLGESSHQRLHLVCLIHVDVPEICLNRVNHHQTRPILRNSRLQLWHVLQGEPLLHVVGISPAPQDMDSSRVSTTETYPLLLCVGKPVL